MSGWTNSSGFGAGFAGGNNTNAFGNNNLTNQNSGLFGSTNLANQASGVFGNTSSMFGQKPQQNLGGLFGNSGNNTANNTSVNTGTTGGLFGNANTGNTTASGSTGLFGSNNNNTASKGLFGASGTSNSGGLFGNSNTTSTGAAGTGMFSNNSNNNNASGGLFGNSTAPTTLNTGSGLFGNKPAGTQSGGLFGNSNTQSTGLPGTNSNTGGLFGNASQTGGLGNTSNTQSGGLFGNANTKPTGLPGNSTQSGGLFGSKPAGLLGNTSNTQSGGLFGSTSNTQSGGLFGNSNSQSTGLNAGNTQSGGLFGNSNTLSGGLFGKSAAPSGGLFGNSQSGGLLGNSKPASSGLLGNSGVGQNNTNILLSNPNPYSSDSILATINKTELVMPQSITGSLFAKDEPRKSKRSTQRKSTKSLSLFSKLALTFKFFRSSDTDLGRLKGIFTQLNFVKDNTVDKAKYSVTKPSKSHPLILLLHDRGTDLKRLVIKSKPLKFHLINADKVLSAKGKRVLTLSLGTHTYSDDEISDAEVESPENDRQIAKEVPLKIKPAEPKKIEPEVPEDYQGYWCSPPLLELYKLDDADLANVENFIVGRQDVGQVAYNYPVDLTLLFARCADKNVLVANELFDRIFKLEGSIVRVYEEEGEEKPPIGVELNVPATITLYAPPRKNISKQEHIRKLQNLTGMEFVTFDPVTDNWTFKVKHFSVWGLIDDSEEEGDEEMKNLRALKKEQDKHEGEASAIYSRIYASDEYNQELKRQRIGGSTKGVPGGWDYNTSADGALGFKQKLVQEEINRQINLYKEDKSVDALAANASDITIESDEDVKSPNSLALETPLYPDEVKNYDYLRQIVNVIPPDTDMNDLVDEKAYEPDIEDEAVFDRLNLRPLLATSKDWLVQLELANDMNSALTPYLTIPRTQKLTLKAVNDILFSDLEHSVNADQISTPIKKLQPVLLSSSADFASVPKLVQNLLLKATMEARPNGFPHLVLDSSFNFKDIALIIKPDMGVDILDVASILFDPIDLSTFKKYEEVDYSDLAVVQRLEVLERRRKFSNWLKLTNKSISDEDPLLAIQINVINGEIYAAVKVAMASHNSHVASLLTLLDSNDAVVRSIAQNQLDDWNVNKTTNLIPAPLVTIYKILAGKLDEVAAHLSFRESLGLHAFYSNPAKSLSMVFKSVADNGSSDYLADLVRVCIAVTFDGPDAGIASIKSSGLSATIKWLFLQLLRLTPSLSGDEISESFGRALSACGLWKEAIFVFASMTNDEKTKQEIRSTVIDHVDQIKNDVGDEETYLVTVLGVPRDLIYEASALDLAKKHDYWGQGFALAHAHLWTEAHTCICLHLGPNAVIDNDYALKSQLRSLIIEFPDQGAIIPNWNQGAGLYASYFNVIEAFDLQDLVGGDELNSLLNNLALVDDYGSFTVKVAVKIMSKRIGDIAFEYQVPDLKRKIMGLQLGENEVTYFENRLAV